MRRLARSWWVLLGVLTLLGLWRVHFDTDVLNLLPPDQPTVQGLKIYQRYFSNARELIITVRAPSAEQAEHFAGALAGRLRLATNLVERVSWQAPWMEHPDQAAEILAYLWFNQPPEFFGSLTNRLAPGNLAATLADARETLATSLSPMDIAKRAIDPYDLLDLPALTNFSGFSAEQSQGMFASAGGTFRVLFVQARTDLPSYGICERWLKAVQQLVGEVQKAQPGSGELVIHYTGRPAFVTEIAASMQRDLTGSIVGTALIIAALFWLAHRRWLPMLWLLTLLALVLVATLGLGGLLLGTVSVVSLGFAAVLLGLAVDYAVVHYQEAIAHPDLSVPEIRRAIAPSILWAAITTITAFLMLNLGGLPGLAQLGSLVAIGVALAGLVMVVAFLPPLFPERRRAPADAPRHKWWSYFVPANPGLQPAHGAGPGSAGFQTCRIADFQVGGRLARPAGLEARDTAGLETCATRRQLSPWLTAGLLLVLGSVLWVKRPGVDRTADALRPHRTQAELTLDELTAAVGIPKDPLWVIVSGQDEGQVYQKMCRAEEVLQRGVSKGCLSSFVLPKPLWPVAEHQQANRPTARWLGTQGPVLRQAALQAGFNTNAVFLSDQLVHYWDRFGAGSGLVWPTNQVSQWLLNRFVAHGTNQWFALGLVNAATNQVSDAPLLGLAGDLHRDGVLLAGWSLLGSTTLQQVRARLWMMVLPMVALVLLSLWLAFRRAAEILLGLAVLSLSGLCLLAVMALAGWSWNLLNLMGLPLILGTGVDYGIFIQLGLRRHGGDIAVVRRSIGRALLLCGGTAIAGFGSLACSSNLGMASLGKVCAVGIAGNMLIAIYLLPGWWSRAFGARGASARVANPSSFYRAWSWRLGLALTRRLPTWVLKSIAVIAGEVYCLLQRERAEVVRQNLLPAVGGDHARAHRTTRKLHREFALKLLDLWRFENGLPVKAEPTEQVAFNVLTGAKKRGKGLVLVTPHLGNWEIGGPLMDSFGIRLLVLTQAEPGPGLTELRRNSRARWGIETLVVGSDAFAFVEVIKRLQDGAAVALLIDRPPPPSAVTVELFGRPFRASIAAAELARASGCALVGVAITRQADGYQAKVMPEFVYDRRALGTRQGRQELTQQILRAFEPEIQQNPEQWFHFVPLWPEGGNGKV